MKKSYLVIAALVATLSVVLSSPLMAAYPDANQPAGSRQYQMQREGNTAYTGPQRSPGYFEEGEAAGAKGNHEETVQAATLMARDLFEQQSIPRSILENAAGVAIIPDMLKAGFIVGGRHGTGVLLTRQGDDWSPPVFISSSGGSIGAQAGVTTTDLVLVFLNPRNMQELLQGDLTLGADAVVAAGPAGAAGTVSMKDADVLTYQRTQGLFAGVSVSGGVLNIDREATREYYSLASRGDGTMAYYPSVDDILTFRGRSEMKQVPQSAEDLQNLLQQYVSGSQGESRVR